MRDHVHAFRLESLKRLVGCVRKVDHTRNDDRIGAVLNQPDLLNQLRIAGLDTAEVSIPLVCVPVQLAP